MNDDATIRDALGERVVARLEANERADHSGAPFLGDEDLRVSDLLGRTFADLTDEEDGRLDHALGVVEAQLAAEKRALDEERETLEIARELRLDAVVGTVGLQPVRDDREEV